MQVEGKVGIIAAGPSSVNPLRTDQFGSLVTLQGGKYSEAALAGRVFSIANQAKIATTAALATTYTGLTVGNPVGSGVNLVLLQAGFGLQIASDAAGIIGLMTGLQTTTVSLTPRPAKIDGAASKARANAGQTIGTPVLERVLGSYGTVAATAWGLVPACQADIDGAMVITPGAFVAFYATTATTACLVFSLVWEEVKI
jgi:hypothetical protein